MSVFCTIILLLIYDWALLPHIHEDSLLVLFEFCASGEQPAFPHPNLLTVS